MFIKLYQYNFLINLLVLELQKCSMSLPSIFWVILGLVLCSLVCTRKVAGFAGLLLAFDIFVCPFVHMFVRLYRLFCYNFYHRGIIHSIIFLWYSTYYRKHVDMHISIIRPKLRKEIAFVHERTDKQIDPQTTRLLYRLQYWHWGLT